MENAIEVELNKTDKVRISPLELQIAYKLFLGSKKDLEDARFLFDLFKNKIDKKELMGFIRLLNVLDKLNYLGEVGDSCD